MTAPFPESAEELFEEAPCGYLLTRQDGTILRVNRTFERLTGHARGDLIGKRRFVQLLSVGGRIYHETHYAPLLQMQRSISEIAFEIVRADGSRLPVLVNSVLRPEKEGRRDIVRTTVFDVTDRRRFEQELVDARRREHDIAQRLQQSLLAGALPEASGLDLGRSYEAAVAGLDVGGDWYDAFWIDEGATLDLVVGDVVGRGIEAAATMGQLRSAMRALASTGLSPGPLLSALDEYARRHDVGRMSTIVCARLDLGSGELRYACAGHPPPLILDPEGPPRFVWDGRSAPLDAIGRSQPRPEGLTVLPPSGGVLLYTDGLIERRGEALDAGMDRLAREATHGYDGAADAVQAISRALRQPDHRDDVCLLLARRR